MARARVVSATIDHARGEDARCEASHGLREGHGEEALVDEGCLDRGQEPEALLLFDLRSLAHGGYAHVHGHRRHDGEGCGHEGPSDRSGPAL